MPGAVETLDVTQFRAWADNLARGVEDVDLTEAFREIRLMLVSATRDNFDRGQAPDGTPWAPLKRPRTLRKSTRGRVRRKRKQTGQTDLPLRDTGLLMGSVTGGAGEYLEVGPRKLVWGSNIDRAAYHQRGTKTIPARPFLGVNDQLAQDIESVIADHVERAMGRP